MTAQTIQELDRPNKRLPPRARIIAMMKKGNSQAAIARHYGVSPAAVHHVLNRVFTIEPPPWVPADMHKQYQIIAKRAGEPSAAAWARLEKRERAQA